MAAIEQHLLTVAKAVEDHLDDEIHRLELLDDGNLEQMREQRLQQMKKMAAKKQEWIAAGHGEYGDVYDEKIFFKEAKASERVVCHFYRESVPCRVMDKHLQILAKQHLETRFIRINAEKSPFLTERLRIFMLPTLALVRNAKVEEYVVGFDELGGTDDFSTEELEQRLVQGKVVFEEGQGGPPRKAQPRKNLRKGGGSGDESDDD